MDTLWCDQSSQPSNLHAMYRVHLQMHLLLGLRTATDVLEHHASTNVRQQEVDSAHLLHQLSILCAIKASRQSFHADKGKGPSKTKGGKLKENRGVGGTEKQSSLVLETSRDAKERWAQPQRRLPLCLSIISKTPIALFL